MIDGVIAEGGAIGSKKKNKKYLQCRETEDVYRTAEPQAAFDKRIFECLGLHNQAVKALRYPSDDAKKGEVETIEEQREREQLVS